MAATARQAQPRRKATPPIGVTGRQGSSRRSTRAGTSCPENSTIPEVNNQPAATRERLPFDARQNGGRRHQRERVVQVIPHAGLEHAEHLGREAAAQAVRSERAQCHAHTASQRSNQEEGSVHTRIISERWDRPAGRWVADNYVGVRWYLDNTVDVRMKAPVRTKGAPTSGALQAREARRLSTLLEVSQVLSGTLNLRAALHRVLEILARHHGAVRSAVTLLQDGGELPRRRLGRPRSTGASGSVSEGEGQSRGRWSKAADPSSCRE